MAQTPLPINSEICKGDLDKHPHSWGKHEWAVFLKKDKGPQPASISELLEHLKTLKLKFGTDDPCHILLQIGEEKLTSLQKTPQDVAGSSINNDESQAANLFQHMFAGQPTPSRIVTTPSGAQLLKRNVTKKTDIINTAQGVRNPIWRETHITNIIINSLYRTNPVATTSSNFLLDINSKMVVSIRLSSVKIPPSWYPFDYNFGNNYFGVTSGSIEDISCVDIEPGYYDASGLIAAINTSMSAQGISATLTWSSITNKIKLENTGATDLSFVFYDKNSTHCDSSGCINYHSLLNNNLGYFLGFRNITSAGSAQHNLPNLIIQVLISQIITASAQLNLNTKITAIISVDDFNNNLFAEKVKLIESKNMTIQMPSYYDRFDVSCNPTRKTPIVIASNPRKKTQAQLYTLQQILNHSVTINSITSKKITNTLGMFSLTANEYTYKSFTSDECSPKLYMGPVDLERVHLTIQDSNGYVLNMNYADWECGLEIEQLYQY